jgi:hypothetical protein
MREIHVHIPAGLADGQVIHIHLDEAESVRQPASRERQPAPRKQEATMSDTIEGMLCRLEGSPSASPHLRDTVALLWEMGFEPRLPEMHNATGEREKYLAIVDPAAPTSATGYLRPGFLMFTRPSDWEMLATLPGAIVTGQYVKFPIDGQCELEAARKVKR